jgi:hypothetical protein
MNVTPQSPLTIDGVYFKDRELFLVDDIPESRTGDYGTQDYYIHRLEDSTVVYLPTSLFLVIADNVTLDSRTMREKAYAAVEQRDVDYIKVYKERMGIIVPTSYAEEDYKRHKPKGPTPDVGLPEDR